MSTVGELFDTASDHLRVAVDDSAFASLDPERHVTLTVRLSQFLSTLEQLGEGLGTGGDPRERSRVVSDLGYHLGEARGALQTAQRLLTTEVGDAGPGGPALHGAIAAVRAVRDVIGSHRGPDGAPLTAYAYAFTAQSAQDYLAQRTAGLAYEAGRIIVTLSRGAGHAGVVAAFAEARSHLSQAGVLGRSDTREADPGIAAFPLALPVEADQASSTDRTHAVPARLSEDCDRLSRVAFETLYDRTDHPLSGSDLEQIAHLMAGGRLLAGRLLLQVAETHPETALSAAFREAAMVLRGAAKAWQTAEAAWQHVVDLADPRAHPTLPKPSYDIVRLGKFVQLPQVLPHPASVIVHTSLVRTGQLLYGASWRPEKPMPPETRPTDAVLADARGAGALAELLYRLPATGWQLALAAPVMVQRVQNRLVTDVIEQRPTGRYERLHFYPTRSRQIESLTAVYAGVMKAEQAAAAALLVVAKQAGRAVPRAQLDATAHRVLADQQNWAQQQTNPTARQQRIAQQAAPPPVRRGSLRM
jgi:hypothetical protein